MEDARSFAVVAHAGQLYGGEPYETHLAAVVEILCDLGYDEVYQQAGCLHDVVDDTLVPLSEIRKRFGEAVADLVDAVTGLGPTRQLRNAHIHAGLRNCPSAAVLKLGDRIANVEAAPAGSVYRTRYLREAEMFAAMGRPLVPPAVWLRMELALAGGAAPMESMGVSQWNTTVLPAPNELQTCRISAKYGG